jgi:hypothetical protein
MPRAKKPLKLPASVYSMHGDVPVGDDDEKLDQMEAVGCFEPHQRTITVHTTLPDTDRRRVFWHELIHLALNDSGVTDVLDGREEAVCNALGHYFAAAHKAKKITVR